MFKKNVKDITKAHNILKAKFERMTLSYMEKLYQNEIYIQRKGLIYTVPVRLILY